MPTVDHERRLSLADCVDALESLGGRYEVACFFADDVDEVVQMDHEHPADYYGLERVSVGRYELTVGDKPYTIVMRVMGVVELSRGCHGALVGGGVPPVLAVGVAKKLKQGLVRVRFCVLKGAQVGGPGGPHLCFCLAMGSEGWECYDGGLMRWVKRRLWPEEETVNNLLVIVGEPGCSEQVVPASRETLEETIRQLVEEDEAVPEEISVWKRTEVEVKATGFTLHGLDTLGEDDEED